MSEELKKLLSEYKKEDVSFFCDYVQELKSKKTKNKQTQNWEDANPWAIKKADKWFADCFKKIYNSNLKFDGKHITIQDVGVSFDFVAYKNKMLLAYPETLLDIQLVYKDDVFTFSKENGKVEYKHEFSNPFNKKDDDVIGGYCVIKNKRGEFLTLVSRNDILKSKQVAKTKAIWDSWFAEMCFKTVMKKAVKTHFDDIYTDMEDEDNQNYDLEKPVYTGLSESIIDDVANCKNLSELEFFYKKEKDKISIENKKEFNAMVTAKKMELKNANS